ncbi:rRNA methyltransferase [Paucibacter sp. KBW04]|uniref:TrmH family RNA methyltransferase n=1 Tax=Paucibacter sp. KBW04 TaxID=2153361 RepID=UPI000F56074E|nr:RNA methyltransferase [Paucibacter sp. KBW04]RQO63214.1 rRNA methyltransferase [Paucibacter sp. KBW04]
MSEKILHITSRDNPALQRLRKLSQDGGAYRKLGGVWLEGDHLARACLQRGHAVTLAVLTEEGAQNPALRDLADAAPRQLIVPAALFKGISGLESPAQIGFEIPFEAGQDLTPGLDSVVLDRLQDAGNVGTILRNAAAFGFKQVLALKGTAALWSPKVLRAGMGAHFGLHLIEGLSPADLDALQVPLIATSSYAESQIHQLTLPKPCAWVMGHEGQGVQADLMQRCALTVGIPQPGGEESLNVGSAAAICLYESARQRLV